MTTLYKKYLGIKDKFCIYYYGLFNEFALQLIYLRPTIEKELPGLELYISCKNELKSIIGNPPRVVYKDDFQEYHYAHSQELRFNQVDHPVMKLLEDSNISLSKIHENIYDIKNSKCTIITNNFAPFGSLTSDQIKNITELAQTEGYTVEVNGTWNNSGWVIGVESQSLYLAAMQGIRCSLVPVGLGTKLFKKMFPKGEILTI